MGESPEAIEGQAKLFRVLIAYAKYSPQVGYSQAAVLLMQLGEEEAFWALTALLDKPKYLQELFDLNLTKVQHQVKVFDQFLKHRKPTLSQHMESVGVLSVHFVMPWFLTLFSSLPCWDSVLAVWDLIILARPVRPVPHRSDHHRAAGASTDGAERRGGGVTPAAQSTC
ncbi:TBC1 domain family member 10B [Larimichthys crocea]|uniref:Uncharacterized protein n=1 Tax=Larimichthys crocea TaxID=215358 RepID=A0ACD3QDG5_LARCR|nr:TBC1 domain family member 10B [Larimichthys crocea]